MIQAMIKDRRPKNKLSSNPLREASWLNSWTLCISVILISLPKELTGDESYLSWPRKNYERIRADPSFLCLDLCLFSFFLSFPLFFLFYLPLPWNVTDIRQLTDNCQGLKRQLCEELFHQRPKGDEPAIPRQRHENQPLPAIPTTSLH